MAVATNPTHYGKPKTGCESDEEAVRVQGLSGDFCSPKCNSQGSCPSDVPKGDSATPQCALRTTTGDKYCALICQSDSDCGNWAAWRRAIIEMIVIVNLNVLDILVQDVGSHHLASRHLFMDHCWTESCWALTFEVCSGLGPWLYNLFCWTVANLPWCICMEQSSCCGNKNHEKSNISEKKRWKSVFSELWSMYFIDKILIKVCFMNGCCLYRGPWWNGTFPYILPCCLHLPTGNDSRYWILPEDHGSWSLHLWCLQQDPCGNHDVPGPFFDKLLWITQVGTLNYTKYLKSCLWQFDCGYFVSTH